MKIILFLRVQDIGKILFDNQTFVENEDIDPMLQPAGPERLPVFCQGQETQQKAGTGGRNICIR